MAGIAALTPEQAAVHQATIAGLVQGLAGVVLGQDAPVREVVLGLLSRGHILLEGPPGTAKTLLVRALNAALGMEFRRIQFTPDLMPSDITGVSILGGDGQFTFRPGPLFADLVLADEINRAPAKTQAALLEAMQERSVTVDGTTHALSPFFSVFATQNSIEFEGTYPLPEAELDRFLLKTLVGYPDESHEDGVLHRVLGGFEADLPASYGLPQLVDAAGLGILQAAVRRVRVDPALTTYVVALVRATRQSPTLILGASPRASVALLRLSQSAALLDGREFVIPDDIKALAPAVLRHRIAVAPELELEGVTPDDALRGLLERVAAP